MAREGEFDSCAADGLNFNMTPILQYRLLGFFIILLGLGLGIGLIVVVGWILYRKFGTPVPSAVTCAGARQVRSSSTEGSPSSHDQSPIEGTAPLEEHRHLAASSFSTPVIRSYVANILLHVATYITFLYNSYFRLQHCYIV